MISLRRLLCVDRGSREALKECIHMCVARRNTWPREDREVRPDLALIKNDTMQLVAPRGKLI